MKLGAWSRRYGRLRPLAETSAHVLLRSRGAVLKIAKGDRSGLAREARALRAIEGPGIVRLLATHGEPPQAIALERVPGPTLADRIARRRLSGPELARLARRLAALQGAVAAGGFVHGDLKPENVILPGGSLARAVLVDFETAVPIGEPSPARLSTPYSAPERLFGATAADPRSDVFAVGALLVAAAEGASPFAAETRDASVLQVLALEPPALVGVDEALARAISVMLRKSPEERPSSVAAALAEEPDEHEASSPEPRGAPVGAAVRGARRGDRLLVPPGAPLESIARWAASEGTLLLHVSAADEPYASVAPHLLRALGLPERPSFARATSSLRARGLSKRHALHLAEILGAEPGDIARAELRATHADAELLRRVRREAILALVSREPPARFVVTLSSGIDRASRDVVEAIARRPDALVVAEAGALELSGAHAIDVEETGPASMVAAERDELLAAVALFSGAFERDDLRQIAGAFSNPSEVGLAGALTKWLAWGILRADAFGRQFRFAEPGVQQDLAARVPEERRRRIHARIASWTASRHPRAHRRIARSFAAAGEPLRAAFYAWRGAASALESSDLDGTAELLSLADAELARASGSVRALLGGLLDVTRAQLLRWQGKHVDASLASRRALAILPSGSIPWCDAVGERATAAGKLGDPSEVLAVASALRVAPSAEARLAWDRACARTAVQLFYQGKKREALALTALFRERTVRSDGTPDERRRGLSPGALVTAALYGGRLDEHVQLLEQSRRAFDSVGDERSAVLYGSAVGFALGQLGDYAAARRVLEKTELRARSSSLPTLGSLVEHNLGEVLARAGNLDLGIDVESSAIEALRAQKDVRFLAGSLAYRARMHLLRGEAAKAEADAREAIALGASNASLAPLLFGTLAGVLLENGRPDEALAAAERACASLTAGPVEAGGGLAELGRARALLALGRAREGRAAARRALRALEARAARFVVPRWRRSFLDRVIEHRALRELAEARS